MIWLQVNLITAYIRLPGDQSSLKHITYHFTAMWRASTLQQNHKWKADPQLISWVFCFSSVYTIGFKLHWMNSQGFPNCFPWCAAGLHCLSCELRDWSSVNGNYLRCRDNPCGSMWVTQSGHVSAAQIALEGRVAWFFDLNKAFEKCLDKMKLLLPRLVTAHLSSLRMHRYISVYVHPCMQGLNY